MFMLFSTARGMTDDEGNGYKRRSILYVSLTGQHQLSTRNRSYRDRSVWAMRASSAVFAPDESDG